MENDNLGFDSNFDSVISTVFNEQQVPENTGESPSPVTTDGDAPEVQETSKEVKVETTGSETQNVETDTEIDEPKMVPYNEQALLKELSNSIKQRAGIDINVSDDTQIDSFLDNLTSNIIEKEFNNPDSVLLEKAREYILNEKGINEEVLAIATGIPYGIDRNQYMEFMTVRDFAEQEIAPDDFESLKTLYATYHSLKGISDDDLESYVEADIDRNDISLIEKRKDFLRNYAEKGLIDIDDQINRMYKAKADFDSNRKKEVNDVISSLLKENEFTKEEIDAYISGTTKKTEEIILPDGTKRPATSFEKKKYEYSQKNLKDAIKENILFFLDKKEGIKMKSENKEKAKQAGGFMSSYMNDINSKSEMIVDKKETNDGFSTVKSNL